MTDQVSEEARVIPLRRAPGHPDAAAPAPARPGAPEPAAAEPLWRDLVGDVLRRERQAQERTLRDVADAARISLPYLSEIERGRKEASSEVLAAAARALGLGLGDLLSRTGSELARRTGTASRAVRRAPYDGLCLAA
ncbi:helix-turn-helix domain-containing protein [Streptomyces sp. NPDC090057]|uniref:helix-turn-helix domain-containing protein n=1 Tax=Streptomyces sp. NPDC090057 TaxID=3365935 RepID=UPI0038077BFA